MMEKQRLELEKAPPTNQWKPPDEPVEFGKPRFRNKVIFDNPDATGPRNPDRIPNNKPTFEEDDQLFEQAEQFISNAPGLTAAEINAIRAAAAIGASALAIAIATIMSNHPDWSASAAPPKTNLPEPPTPPPPYPPYVDPPNPDPGPMDPDPGPPTDPTFDPPDIPLPIPPDGPTIGYSEFGRYGLLGGKGYKRKKFRLEPFISL